MMEPQGTGAASHEDLEVRPKRAFFGDRTFARVSCRSICPQAAGSAPNRLKVLLCAT